MDGGPVGAKARLVIDGEEGKQYDEIGFRSFCFSPDSKRTAYVALEGNEHVLVIDGSEVDMASISEGRTRKPRIKEAFFSAHYENVGGGGVVINKVRINFLPVPIVFSPNGQRVAYVADFNGEEAVVVDGEAGRAYPSIYPSSLSFSPDSQRLAYAVSEVDPGDRPKMMATVVVDGAEGKYYNQIRGKPRFSPDSKQVAFIAVVDRSIYNEGFQDTFLSSREYWERLLSSRERERKSNETEFDRAEANERTFERELDEVQRGYEGNSLNGVDIFVVLNGEELKEYTEIDEETLFTSQGDQ